MSNQRTFDDAPPNRQPERVSYGSTLLAGCIRLYEWCAYHQPE